MNKYKSRKCSIEASTKMGQTRLTMNSTELETFLEECVYSDDDEEEDIFTDVDNPIKKIS